MPLDLPVAFCRNSSGCLFLAATCMHVALAEKILKSPPRLGSVIAGLCTSLSLSVVSCLALLTLVSSHGLVTGVRKK